MAISVLLNIPVLSGSHRLPSGWTRKLAALVTMVDERKMEKLKYNGHERLAKYVLKDGQVRFPAPAYFVIARV